VKNHKLASAILDGGFSEFRRQLEYKSKWYGSTITIVDRFYPSSKLCSACGNKKDKLKLSERTYNCESCGLVLDRDLNASLNLKKNAVSYTV
jgi:putative transposase